MTVNDVEIRCEPRRAMKCCRDTADDHERYVMLRQRLEQRSKSIIARDGLELSRSFSARKRTAVILEGQPASLRVNAEGSLE